MSKIVVTLKAAATLDGKIATKTGHSRWITGEDARQKAHEMRHNHDAILVGINTVLADNPRLTTRNVKNGKSPIRVILDSNCRIPPDSLCLNDDGIPVFIVVGSDAPLHKIDSITQRNIRVLKAPTPMPQIRWLLSSLLERNIQTLMVEGGSRIHASFIKEHLADQLVLFLAPKIIGGNEALSWCHELECLSVDNAAQLNIKTVQPIGKDWMVCAEFLKEKHD